MPSDKGRRNSADLAARITAYEKLAQQAESDIKSKIELPKPGLFNAKTIYNEALKIIKKHKEALSGKRAGQLQNHALKEKQHNLNKQIQELKNQNNELMKIKNQFDQAVENQVHIHMCWYFRHNWGIDGCCHKRPPNYS